MTRSYNGFTPKQIEQWSSRQYSALAKNPERRVTVCVACGVDSYVEQHLEDYTKPLDGIIGLCIRCHVVTHGRFDHPEVWDEYVAKVQDGWRFPALQHGATARSEMFNGRRGFDAAIAGPSRGRTVLGDIADGGWLEVGLARRTDRQVVSERIQHPTDVRDHATRQWRDGMNVTDEGWPAGFPVTAVGKVAEGIPVFSQTEGIEGRTTGSRRRCSSARCPGWFIGVRWGTGQLMYPCSAGWSYDSAKRTVRITGGGEISARIVSPAPEGPPPLPRDQWPTRSSLAGMKGWRRGPTEPTATWARPSSPKRSTEGG